MSLRELIEPLFEQRDRKLAASRLASSRYTVAPHSASPTTTSPSPIPFTDKANNQGESVNNEQYRLKTSHSLDGIDAGASQSQNQDELGVPDNIRNTQLKSHDNSQKAEYDLAHKIKQTQGTLSPTSSLELIFARRLANSLQSQNKFSDLTGRKRKRPEQDDAPITPRASSSVPSKVSNTNNPLASTSNQMNNSHSILNTPRTSWSKSKALVIEERIVDTSMTSEWYKNINMKEKYKRSDEVTVSHIKDIISNCIESYYQGHNPSFSELRTQIHNMELWTPEWIKGVLLRKTGILENKGLVRIIEGPDADIFPWDIRDDAKALWMRWIVGDTDGSLLRGIVNVKRKFDNNHPGTSRTVDNTYTWKRAWEVIGNNGLTNGQWWPLRVCTIRDGAHGDLEAGISGKLGEHNIEGAYSIVLADGGYEDQDSLNTIQYCSTRSKDSQPTRGTQMLNKSWHAGHPIRVLRAAPKTAATKKMNKYLPKKGIRYDGLYRIKDMEILDSETAFMRYSLQRIPGQHPVRWEGELARPTPQELREFMLLQLIV
ncbi:unnamed protein product [Blumeria hordei]|uniref:YDG domain-containing protein n=1 Tax=Blumeria hordei TaxID=2867405 RepID=A0A383UQ52_BLUHO|nr:unnamed protein product [Blumeria hordei]